MSLFKSDSIAVIGASRKKHKVGYQILKNLIKFKKVYPVNPKAKKILGKRVYPSIKDIKEKIESAVISVPADIVPIVLEECGQKNIKYVIIISAGFKEVGRKKLEDKIIKIAEKYKIRVVGPNCFGIINTKNHLNTTFSSEKLNKGSISFITQSGALCASILDYAQVENIGFSKIISIGNKSDIDEVWGLKELAKDSQTSTILIYTEGIDNGLEFFNVAMKVNKPIIILKAGKTEISKKDIKFHTGSMAGSNEAYEAAFKEAGIIEANTVKEFLDFGKVFSQLPSPKNDGLVILSNAGGPAVLAADACFGKKINLIDIPNKKELKKILPKQANLNNPMDLIGDARHELYEKSLDIILKNKKVGSVLVILTPQAMTEIDKTAEVIVKLKKKYNKPILTCFIGGKRVCSGIKILKRADIPNFFNISDAIKCFSILNKFIENKNKKNTYYKFKINVKKAKKLIKGKNLLGFKDMKRLLDLYKIPYAKSKLITNKKELLIHSINYPIILKIDKPEILHKTDVGGIILDIKNKKELLNAFEKIKKSLKKNKIDCKDFVIQKMRRGKELIIGVKKDKQFGSLIMFGLGGLYTEVLKDVSFSLIPVSKERADEMIKEVKFYPALKGIRGEGPANINKIKEIILKTSKMVHDLNIKNIDINPLIIDGKNIEVVDCNVKIK